MTEIHLPFGWGVGIPIGDTFRPGSETAAQRINRVLLATKPEWFQTWEPFGFHDSPLFIPSAEDASIPAMQLDRAKNSTLLVLNEPERGWNKELVNPRDAALATTRQLAQLWQIGEPFGWVAPNCNINGKNLDWLASYADWLWKHGNITPTAWGIHFYGREAKEINYHVENFWRWHDRYGRKAPVVVSEFGPGGNATIQQALTVMEYGRRFLDDDRDRVLGTAYFAAGVKYMGHYDVCAEQQLLDHFVDIR